MYVIFLFLQTILSLSFADTLTFRHKNYSFKIEAQSNMIRYVAPLTDLSIKKMKCNEHLFLFIKSKIKNLNQRPYIKSESSSDIEIQIEKSRYLLVSNDANYDFFASFDFHFKTLLIEEKLTCSNN